MSAFRYQAVNTEGKPIKGTIEAPTEQQAYRQLIAQRLTPTQLKPITAHGKSHRTSAVKRHRKRIKPEDIASITHQLSVLVHARIPLVEALQTIADHEPSRRLATILSEVARQVGAGRSLTESLQPHRKVFGDVYIQTVSAAETSGNLITILAKLSEATEEEAELRQAVKAALIYPVSVVVALSLAMFFLVTFVVPRFGRMFEARGVELPILTQAMLTLGESIHTFWWLYAGLLLILATIAIHFRSTSQGRDISDRILHRVPFVNTVLRALAVSRFANILGLSLSSGVGLIESLEVGGRAAGRPMLMNDVRHLTDSVRSGQQLSTALDSCAYLPGFAKQLMRAGESAAELPAMCQVIAHHFAKQTRDLTKNTAKVVEPVLIAGLTGLVLLVALAVFLPMWDMVVVVG